MGNSFSQNRVDGFPDNEVVQLLIRGHDCICLRVGFKKWNIIFILCSVVIGTRYVMGSNNIINCKQQLINQLTTENSKQLARINDLLLLATDTKSLENELKSLKTQLKNSTEHGQILKQKIENQRAELKNLNTKSNQVSLLNTEIERLKSQLKAKQQVIHDADRELGTCKNKIEQLEQEISEYGEILKDLDSNPKEESVENSSQECAICCEVFSEARKRVAYGPCGHSMVCVECSETMLRKTTANVVRGRKSANCPICRTEIESTITLQGIY